MSPQPLSQLVIVSQQSIESVDPCDIINSNISVVNALFEGYLKTEEISPNALRSYFVDYYLAQVSNGGFSQFVYNSRWDGKVINFIREGLRAMGAAQHLVVFEEGTKLVANLGFQRLKGYFASEYFGENVERDYLNTINNRFIAVGKKEDLITLNAAWLRSLPGLRVLSIKEIKQEIARLIAAIPDREQRIAEARANEPRYMILIRALCHKAGHNLDRVTAGDPAHIFNKQKTLAWHFLTDHGHYYMVESAGRALMFHADTNRLIAELMIGE
ncbi:MAG: DUF4375 domain-containing protein [Acidobacteriota bacterium]